MTRSRPVAARAGTKAMGHTMSVPLPLKVSVRRELQRRKRLAIQVVLKRRNGRVLKRNAVLVRASR